ncbi:hypothetical protein SLA2020_239550 [Shorea laevis]
MTIKNNKNNKVRAGGRWTIWPSRLLRHTLGFGQLVAEQGWKSERAGGRKIWAEQNRGLVSRDRHARERYHTPIQQFTSYTCSCGRTRINSGEAGSRFCSEQ